MAVAEKDPFVLIGKLAGLHGIQGWFKVVSHTRPKDSIKKYKTWQIRANPSLPWQNMKVLSVRPQGKGLVARLDGVVDRTAAEKYVGWDIAIHEQQLPNLHKNEFYWRDLIGLRVINHEEQDFGVVDHLIETGANDVLVVKDGQTERLVPYVIDQYITSIDIEAGIIRVEWDADF